MPEDKHNADEQELNISGPEAPVEDAHQHDMGQRISSLNIDSSASDEEVLQRVLETPESELIPWEECTLPSMGLYYGWNDGTIMVRAMTQVAEKILATQRLARTGQSIDYLFKECCRFPEGFDPVELLVGDRVFLLYYLRGITYGNMYEFAVTCPNISCGATNMFSYDLNELAQTITWADHSLGSEPFKIVLPYMSKVVGREFWVGVRFLRAKDANDIVSKRKVKKKAFARAANVKSNPLRHGRGAGAGQLSYDDLDETLSDNLEHVIVNVMGSTDMFKIRNTISKLHSRDTTEIREWLREHTPGIDSTVEITCPDCERDFRIMLPITENFFRPAE